MIKDSRPAFVISLFLVGGLWTSPLLRITFEQMLYLSALDIFCSKAKIYSLVFPGKVLVADSEQADDNFSRQEVNRSGLVSLKTFTHSNIENYRSSGGPQLLAGCPSGLGDFVLCSATVR